MSKAGGTRELHTYSNNTHTHEPNHNTLYGTDSHTQHGPDQRSSVNRSASHSRVVAFALGVKMAVEMVRQRMPP